MTRGLFLTLVFALPAIACGRSTEGLDDAAKRQRIAEMYAEYRSDFPAAPEMSIEELLELGDKTGRVEAGYEADMILVPANPLIRIEALQDVLMVMSNGQLALKRIPFAATD